MGASETIKVDRYFQEAQKQISNQYESILEKSGLSEIKIRGQNLEELKDSLDRINDAIQHPDNFPKFSIKMTPRVGAIVTSEKSEAHYQIGILPILLERKKLILDRIRSLENDEKIEDLQDLIKKKIPNEEDQSRLLNDLNNYRNESQQIKEQYNQLIEDQRKQLSKSEEEKLKLSGELWESRSRIIRSFLEREPAATIIGSFLLMIIALAHLLAITLKLSVPETLNSAFLLILGYFFGQSTSQISSNVNAKKDDHTE